jgi:hypothetical protein
MSLVGKSFIFEDGNKIEVVQIKDRDNGEQLITYHIHQSGALPRKFVMTMEEFETTFGHLFRPKKESD